MRQRITFLHKAGDAVDPASIRISDGSLVGPDTVAAREVRLTLALDELPSELAAVLASVHELHVRWGAPNVFDTVSPLHSWLSPGLHVYYTPQQRKNGDDGESKSDAAVCQLLRNAFGGLEGCVSLNESFVALPTGRFSHSAAYQFYQSLEDLNHLTRYIQDTLCPQGDPLCRAHAGRLTESVTLDISYDSISHAIKVTALSPYQPQPLAVTGTPGHRTEVGFLGADSPPTLEAHELGISGHLVVLGEHRSPAPVAFGFPSRHRAVPDASVTAFFPYHPANDDSKAAGLHPTLKLLVSPAQPPTDDPSCAPHAYLVLPRAVFADRYQLSDPLFLASRNLSALRHLSSPVDLEAPEYAMGSIWGSTALVELARPSPSADVFTAEIPLHLRYLAPADSADRRAIEVPTPVVFWACTSEEGTKFATNPFDRVNLGYDGLFGPRTVFWHLAPRPPPVPAGGTRLMLALDVPVLDLGRAGWVATGTAAVVLLGFGWVVWKLLGVVLRQGSSHGAAADDKKTQ